MYTNLVCAARLQTALHERDVAISLQHAVVRHGVLAVRTVGKDIHLQAILRAATDVSRNRTLVLSQIAPHKGNVAAMNRVVEELLGQSCVRTLVLGYHQQTRGILVDAVYQSRAHIALLEQRQILQVVGERIDQRAAIISAAGVDNHSRLLIYDYQVVILIHHIERDVLGDDLHLALGVGHNQRDAIHRLYLVARLGRNAIYEDVAAVGSRLYAVARAVLHTIDQILIQAQHLLSAIDRDGEVLEHLVGTLAKLYVFNILVLLSHLSFG